MESGFEVIIVLSQNRTWFYIQHTNTHNTLTTYVHTLILVEAMNAMLNEGDALDCVAALMKHHINYPRTYIYIHIQWNPSIRTPLN